MSERVHRPASTRATEGAPATEARPDRDYAVATHLLRLLERLDAGHTVSLRFIQESYGVKAAAAGRYIAWLQAERDLIEVRRGREKHWRNSVAKDASPEAPVRAAAYGLALTALAEFKGTGVYETLEAAAEEARLALTDPGQQKLARLTESFVIRSAPPVPAKDRSTRLASLIAALEERHVCEITYRKRTGAEAQYRIEPWGLVLSGGRLYVRAGKLGEAGGRERRLFDVDAILALHVVPNRRFPEPSAAVRDHHAYFEHAFGVFVDHGDPETVHLQVRGPHAVALQARPAHASQVADHAGTGWLNIRFKVRVCPDLEAFVLGLVPDVRVVAPESLAIRIKQRLEEALSP